MPTVSEPPRRDPAEHFPRVEEMLPPEDVDPALLAAEVPDVTDDPAFAEWERWLRGVSRSTAKSTRDTLGFVRNGYEAYAHGSLKGIAEFLQDQGAPPPTAREREMLTGFYTGFLAALREMERLADVRVRERR